MKYNFLNLLLLSVLFCSNVEAQEKPNIIVLFADDISARELPVYGSTVWSDLHGGDTSDKNLRAFTPVLDKIANEGCFIKTAWAATICGPSRAMMMTGRYAHLHKWWFNTDKGKAPDGKKTWDLYDSSPHTIAHIAKKGGYATFWAGKTQMNIEGFKFDEGCFTPGGETSEKASTTDAYSDFRLETKKIDGQKKLINIDTGKEVAKGYAQSSWYWKPNVQLLNNPKASSALERWPNNKVAIDTFGLSTYGPDVELNFIFDFMERKHKSKTPFFVYHTSHLGHDAFDFLNPESGNKWPGTPKVTWDGKKYSRLKPHVTGDNGVYDSHGTITGSGIYNHVNYLDYQIWLYMKKLKELGEENNTIFIFCADNATSGYGKAIATSQKGTHVPLIIYAPGMNLTKKGEQDILANISDVLPTIADIAGVKIPDNYEIDGKSLVPFLTTKQDKHRDWIYGYQKEFQIIRGNLVLRDGKDIWYDVSKNPADLISFPKITDWSTVSEAHRKERDELQAILPKFNKHDTEHDAPKDGIVKVDPLEVVKKKKK
ncbi:sulfatase-like hydrolase/transferase [Flavobacterium sp. ARAG 55.4]|uniref:sulfatase-like hydrolase/transferase n=1 Tax=Flavobacterium sp. ARAG 55.4 TaxID=3451357 RepID=UPI003F4554AB